jgi:hypothetical protein
MKPFLFLLGLIVVIGGMTVTTIRNQNKLMRDLLGLKKRQLFA